VRLGLLTACLPGSPLTEIAAWAAGHGYGALEVAAWPHAPDRPWVASHLDVATLDADGAARVRALFDQHGLLLSALAYYENNLVANEAQRNDVHEHLRRCVDAAVLLGCPLVGTFVGRDVSLSVTDNLRLAEKVLPPLVDYAGERGVRLVVENCPMEGWHPDGAPANLAYSPELWDWMASLGLWLNFDPSHLVPLGIDPLAALVAHRDKILHVQAKDVQVDTAARDRYGVLGRVIDREPWNTGWWQFRVPGLGEVDWRRLVDALYVGGYDGVVSVEHEDPVWSGTPERVQQGLVLAERTLGPLLVA
jgi:sugar phosphate isomerase/epimerase